MSDDVRADARRLLSGITPGPWVAEYSREQGNCVIPADARSTREAVAVTRLYHQVADAEFIAAAPKLVERLLTELDRAEQQIDTMIEEGVEAGLGLKSLHVEDGRSELSVTTSGVSETIMLAMLDAMADALGDASNYIEFDLRRRGKTPVSVCIRRFGHPTPHELREKAEAERDAALATLQQVRARIDLAETWSRYLVPDHDGALIDADNVDTLLEDLTRMVAGGA